jgi:hypothetical protein
MGFVPKLVALLAPPAGYTVLERFTMPTSNGPRTAIAVTTESGKVLQSLYTLMLKTIAMQVWYLAVLAIIAVVARKNRSRNINVANVIIWNAQASPLDVVKQMISYFLYISAYAVMWAALAAVAWAASIAVSLLVSPDLILGNAAPVSVDSIYVPPLPPLGDTGAVTMRINALSLPSDLRAIGLADNISTNANVQVGLPQISTDLGGNTVYQVDYAYSITDVDFGLQHAAGLTLTVEGSCVTEYGWYNGSTRDGTDVYHLFGNESDIGTASVLDGGPPLGKYFLPPGPPSGGANISYAILISSVGRKSFDAGTDPWYLTEPLLNDTFKAIAQVKPGRPPLSCWQTDIWSYNGQSRSINQLDELGVLPPALVTIFQRFLSLPRILNLAQALGTFALKSAGGSLGYYFDAQNANLHDDLQRLVIGAYAATVNTLEETIKFSPQYSDVGNLVVGNDSQFLPGLADFVIYSPDVSALSIPMLIVVPIIAAVLLGLVFLLTTGFPCYAPPWGYVNALKASIVYSSLDSHQDPVQDNWVRKGATPFYKTDGEGKTEHEAKVRPKFNRGTRALSWEGPKPA